MRKYLIFSILLILGLIFFLEVNALTITPAKMILSADPGEIFEIEMRVRNDLDVTTTYYSSVERYAVRGGDQPIFIPENIGLPTWIEITPPEITLGPKESKDVSIKIGVPEDAPPGGHYAAIFWSTASPKGEGTGVAIITRVGALVLLEVSGQVIEAGKIVSFGTAKKILNYLPVSFNYAFLNEGTVHLGPTGQLTVKNVFGKTRATLDANPGGFYALPKTTRTFPTESWQPEKGVPKIEGQGFLAELKREWAGFALGFYKADLNLEYGKEKKTAQANFSFWVLPWRILLISILILAAIILFFTKGIKKYNQWIIAKAKARY